MVSTRSIRSIARFISGAAFVVATVAWMRDRPADACSGGFGSIVELTSFDPHVIGDSTWDGLFFEPFSPGFGGPCSECGKKSMLADWRDYLKDDIEPATWEQIMTTAPDKVVASIARRLADNTAPMPAGFAKSMMWSKPESRAKLRSAVEFVQLARRFEPFATFDLDAKTPPVPADIANEAKRNLGHDAFLSQRYAYLALRAHFYAREFSNVTTFYEKNRGLLSAPSKDLNWRARYFFAGALRRTSNISRANYELARIHANAPDLAGVAVQDFHPVEQADWQKTLVLATSPREKAELWRLAGIRSDGIVAINEIRKLEPNSNLIAVLLLRELARAESMVEFSFNDPQQVAAQNKAIATVETIARELAYSPGADRPWLMELVLGHIAARRGDVVNARVHLQKALAQRPGDVLVMSQAKASLSMAMSVGWRINPRDEQELAHAMLSIDKKFDRTRTVETQVRHNLSAVYAKAGRLVDAEFLEPAGQSVFDDSPRGFVPATEWLKASFINDMIARMGRNSSEFDRFVLDSPITKNQLVHELALRTLLDGNFAVAGQTLQSIPGGGELLHTDPFQMRNLDCHDCDHEKYEHAKWTHASFIAHLVELERAANGTGEAAAVASLSLGNALYNITEFGNARIVLAGTHQAGSDTRAAERWYKRAFDLTKDRELKAKAAFFAAKCELGAMIEKARQNPDQKFGSFDVPTPVKWFAVEKTFKDTRYYKEILHECSNFNAYAITPP